MADPESKDSWRRRQRQDNAAWDKVGGGRVSRRLARGAAVYGLLVFLLTALFVHGHRLPYRYLGWAASLGMVFGLALAGFDRLALLLRSFLAARCNRAICGFLLFFAYLLGYLVLFSLIVTYPVGTLIEQGSGSTIVAMEYGLSASNVILFFAVLGWLDWKRLVVNRRVHLPWFKGRLGKESNSTKTLDK